MLNYGPLKNSNGTLKKPNSDSYKIPYQGTQQVPSGKLKWWQLIIFVLLIIFTFMFSLGMLSSIPQFGSAVSSGQGYAFLGFLAAIAFPVLSVPFLINYCKRKKYSNWMAGSIASFVLFFVIIASLPVTDAKPVKSAPQNTNATASSSESKPNSSSSKVVSSVPTITKEEFEPTCEEYEYKEIARNPNEYIGKAAKFTGKVVQVQESGKSVVLRVNVTKDKYNSWDDTIYVEYFRKDSNESRILEDDIIKIYGNLSGLKTYTTVLGSQLSVPQITAKYIYIEE